MKTVWIKNDEPWAAKYSDSEFINYKTDNLAKFLRKLMSNEKLEKIINESFKKKKKIGPKSDKKLIKAINETINLVDSGKIRVASKQNGSWVVNQWIKKAILLSFQN